MNRHLVGTSWTEAYTRKFGKLQFDEKILANAAWNDGNASVRMPVYKKLAFSLSTIDNFQNDPQVGYNKNSFHFTTGFARELKRAYLFNIKTQFSISASSIRIVSLRGRALDPTRANAQANS